MVSGGIVMGLLGVPFIAAAAQVWVDTRHTTWENAAIVNPVAGEQIVFARLRTTGEARWLGWKAPAGQRVQIELAVPLDTDSRFEPTLVIFQPDTVTAGPLLPIEQPANTLALVYPLQPPERRFERLTQTESALRFRQTIEIDQAGQAYLAVYNASAVPGTYRLILRSSADSFEAAAAAYPARWWYTQAWAGWSFASLFPPGAVIGLIAGGWWFGFRPRSRPVKRKRR